MRIGDFAKLCKTKISVLRHYDKTGLIIPDFVDKFTGYRYYDPKQQKDFEQITKYKKLGFSLKDIKKIITLNDNNSIVTLKIFDDKIKELHLLISQIEQEKNDLLNLKSKKETRIIMNNTNQNSEIDIDSIQFENDPEAVGKWEIIGEYDTKEYFLSNSKPNKSMYGEKFKEIYFLPNGQRYWIYSWTKGFIINKNGDYTAVNPYKIEEINGEKYMFADWKSYDYIKNGGETTVLVLKKLDGKQYTLDEISRKDDIDKPFFNDKKILGSWKAVAFIRSKDEYFNHDNIQENLFFNHAEFQENGRFSRNKNGFFPYLTWTKGYILSNNQYHTAEKYEIKIISGKEFLFIEWKSGDYIWGGWEPNYYVFVRE